MKTRELDVWVMFDTRDGKPSHINMHSMEAAGGFTKCKLMVPEPEKKLTITESEFDEAWNSISNCDGLAYSHIKQKLFGD